MIKFDYAKDVMTVDGVDFQLVPFRKWLLKTHEQLCNGHYIRAIKTGNKTRFTYDWQQIYFLADQYEFTKQYIHELHLNTTGKTPPTDPLSMEGPVS